MKRLLCITLILCAVGTLPALAGRIDVSGAVFGVWPSGSTVYVSDSVYVPVAKSLVIEPGVDIVFKSSSRFTVQGALFAQGTERAPIMLHTSTGWEGFYFTENSRDERVLQWVMISPESGTPSIAVTAVGSSLLISDCRLKGKLGCLSMEGGQLRSDRNLYGSSGFCSKTVYLRGLTELPPPDWSSWLRNDIIVADVLDEGHHQGDQEFTAGLMIDDCTPDMHDNTVSVRAPGRVVGVYFATAGTFEPMLQFCVIAVRSLGSNSRPSGIVNDWDGPLQVRRCTIDVAKSPQSPPELQPIGVWASGQATANVNSCVVVVDHGDAWFTGSSGGIVVADYITRWATDGSTSLDEPGLGDNPPAEDNSPTEGVILGDSIFTADPHFLHQGTWGEWTNSADIYNYYALQSNSPCIDRADPDLGDDPDSTRPDIGRFYYRQFITDFVDQHSTVPSGFGLASPFPNPFNATAIVPFVLSRDSQVRVVVYDVLGREVTTLTNGPQAAGNHQLSFQANSLASGLYFVTMELNGARVAARPLLLLR